MHPNLLCCTAQHFTAHFVTFLLAVLNLTAQVQLEKLTTNHIYSVKVAAASESIYTPGQVLGAV